MTFSKIAMGLCLTASFGLMACGSDSSSSASDSDTISCKVTEGNPFKTEMKAGDYSYTTTIEDKDGKITTTEIEIFATQTEADKGCKIAKDEAESDEEVSCDGKTVKTVVVEESNEFGLSMAISFTKTLCEAMDGKSKAEWEKEAAADDDDDEEEDGDDKE